MKFSPHPCYISSLRLKYSPQHPILKHPHPTFLTQCQRSSFTPIYKTTLSTSLYELLDFLSVVVSLRTAIAFTKKNISLSKWKHSCFIFGRSWLQISRQTPTPWRGI
jgi:hypothetical protein